MVNRQKQDNKKNQFSIWPLLVVILSGLFISGFIKLPQTFATTTTWDFTAGGNYTYDSTLIEVIGGVARLILIDQTDNDNNATTGFAAGTNSNTQWDAVNNWLELDATGQSSGSGNFTSRIIDAGTTTAQWTTSTWTPQRPYYKELPDSAGIETAYITGNIDMTSNVLLFHMNESTTNAEEGGTVTDNSGSSNNGTLYTGSDGLNKSSSTAQFTSSTEFDGVNDYIEVTDSGSLDMATALTIATWVRSLNTTNTPGLLLKTYNGLIASKTEAGTAYQLGVDKDNKPYFAFEDIGTNLVSKYDNTIPATSDGSSTNGRIPLGVNTAGDDVRVYAPSVIKDGSLYKMWYAGFDGTNWQIYHATSVDGLTWTKYDNSKEGASDTTGTNGRIPLGTGTKGDDAQVYFSSVIKDGGVYKMWYSGADGSTYRIYMATSTDGLTWNKYDNTIPANSDGTSTNGRIPLGTAGKGDSGSVESAKVIKDGDVYRMWYIGADVAFVYRVYYATSTDGLTWTKYDNTIPAISDGSSTNGRIPTGNVGRGDVDGIYAASVIKDGSTYKMWYTGYDQFDTILYYATSQDGLTWTKYDNTKPSTSDTTSSNGRIPIGTAGKGDVSGADTVAVIKEGPVYKMWYGGYSNGTTPRIYYATIEAGVTSTVALSTGWNHVAGVVDGTSVKLYVNGSLNSSVTTAVTGVSNSGNLIIGNKFDGALDELAIFNRVLTVTEIADLYKRAALRLRFQVRSCDDAVCAGETFIGPDGTATDYYEELDSNATTTPSYGLTNLATNRYFQYKAFFTTASTTLNVELKSVTTTPDHYNGSDTTIVNSGTAPAYSVITSFSETLGSSNVGTVRYQLSPDNASWYYWNNTNWVLASLGYAQANTSTLVNTNIGSFDDDVGSGNFYLKAYFRSDLAAQPVELDQVSIVTDPSIYFTAQSSSGSEAVGTVEVEITLSDVIVANATVDYAVAGASTAVGSGVDYTMPNGTATITSGNTTTTISIIINNDTSDESDETIIINLSSASGAVLGANTSHTFTIIDNDSSGGGFVGAPPRPPLSPLSDSDLGAGIILGGFKIIINSDEKYTNSRFVDLEFDGGPDAVSMAISNTRDFVGVSREDYNTQKTNWDLCFGLSVVCPKEDGEYSVYVRFYSASGLSTATISKTIFYTEQGSLLSEEIIKGLPLEEDLSLGVDRVTADKLPVDKIDETVGESPVVGIGEEIMEAPSEDLGDTEKSSDSAPSQTSGSSYGSVSTKPLVGDTTLEDEGSGFLSAAAIFARDSFKRIGVVVEDALQLALIVYEKAKVVVNNGLKIVEENETEIKVTLTASAPAILVLNPITLANIPYIPVYVLNMFSKIFPFLGIRRRKRNWGIIYDTITKNPIPLVIVRLYSLSEDNKNTKKRLMQTMVTDSGGRFGFLPILGSYSIEAIKPSYAFPSKILEKDQKQDGLYENLYFGETINIQQEDFMPIKDIPLDPLRDGFLASPESQSAVLKKLSPVTKFIQRVFSQAALPLIFLGILFALSVAYVSLQVTDIGLLAFYCAIAYMQIKLMPKREKSWGTVFDAKTMVPVELSVIKIFDTQYNKILKSRLTDYKGRYQFMPPEGSYKLDVVKNEYMFPSKVKKNIFSKGRYKYRNPYYGDQIKFKTDKGFINADIPLDSGHQ